MDEPRAAAIRPKSRSGRVWSWLGVAVLLAVTPAAPAGGAETTLRVQPGGLAISPAVAASDFVAVTLDGTAKTTTAIIDPFSVVDGRGSGAGWTLTVEGTIFTEWDGANYVSGGRTLPPGSLSMAAPSVAAEGADSPPPLIPDGPYSIDGAAVTVAAAAADAGMGSYAFTHPDPLALTVPAGAYAATYRSEITFSVTSGP